MAHDPCLIAALEPDQLAAATEKPLPRRVLGRGTLALLILLRIYVVIAVPVVGYAFVHALLVPQP
jgi:hypothetical protein